MPESRMDRRNKVTSRRFKNRKPTTIIEDGIWVYQNMQNMKVTASQAPSMGSWGLLLWARKNPDDFYRSGVLRRMADGVVESSKYKDDGQDLDKLDALLGKMANAQGSDSKPKAKKRADRSEHGQRRA